MTVQMQIPQPNRTGNTDQVLASRTIHSDHTRTAPWRPYRVARRLEVEQHLSHQDTPAALRVAVFHLGHPALDRGAAVFSG